MFRKFKSLAHEQEFGYSFDSQAWDSHAPIESNFRVFQNYNDGLTAHTPDWSVHLEQLPDYLASLAQAMLTDDELAQALVFTFARRPSVAQIEFAARSSTRSPRTRTGSRAADGSACSEQKGVSVVTS
jgi:hypothetical protein